MPRWCGRAAAVAGVLLAAAAAGLPLATLPVPLAVRTWCDFGGHAARWSRVPAEQDPVFRPPSDAAKAELGHALAVARSSGRGAGVPLLSAVFLADGGPALARLALLETDAATLASALAAAQVLAHAHPRIASFAVPHLAHPDASVAIAAVTLLFGTRCDTAALYALDALRHPQPAVARATVAGLRPLLALRPDVGVARRLVRWVEDRAVPRTHAEARAAAVALLGEAGWLGEAEAVGRLRKDRDPAVAAAAVRALAVLQPYPSAPLGARATVPQLPGR